jgi:hypothetical protein
MREHTRVSHPVGHLPCSDVEVFKTLAELTLDLRWPWNHATRRMAASGCRHVSQYPQDLFAGGLTHRLLQRATGCAVWVVER